MSTEPTISNSEPLPSDQTQDPFGHAPQAISETPAPEPSNSSLRAIAKQKGYTDEDLSAFTDDSHLASALFDIAQEYGQFRQQAEPFVHLGQRVAPYADKLDKLDDFSKWLQDQQQAPATDPAPAAPATPSPPAWSAPEYDPAWESVSIEADPVGYAQAQAKLRKYQEHERATIRKLAQDPSTIVAPIIEQMWSAKEQSLREYADQIAAKATEQFEQRQRQQAEDAEVQSWLRDNAKTFYMHDAAGKAVVGKDGNLIPTATGQQAWQLYEQAKGWRDQTGNTLPVKQAIAFAMTQVQSQPAQPAPLPGQPPKSEQRFMDTVTEAERYPERRPGVADDSAPTSMYPDAEDQFAAAIKQAAAIEGVSLNT